MPITAVRRAGALPVAGHLSPAGAQTWPVVAQCSPSQVLLLPSRLTVFLLSGSQSFLERSKGCDLKVAESLQPGCFGAAGTTFPPPGDLGDVLGYSVQLWHPAHVHTGVYRFLWTRVACA